MTVNRNGGSLEPRLHHLPLSHREGPQYPAQYKRRSRASNIFMGLRGARGIGRSGWCFPDQDQEQPHPRAQRGQLCALQTGVMPRPTRGISEGFRPVSPGSEGQNWRTAPPLASGHLTERSAPGGTGSPRSIFRRGSRNPEDRVERQRREEKRLIKEVEGGTGQHLEVQKHGAVKRGREK